jgi:hypothetical protein
VTAYLRTMAVWVQCCGCGDRLLYSDAGDHMSAPVCGRCSYKIAMEVSR